MLRTGILLSLCLTSLALECFVRRHTDPCATTQKCDDGEVCEIVKQTGATTQGCRPKDRCGVSGGFCCDEDECNIDFDQSNSTNVTETGITCVLGTISKDDHITYTGTCPSYCRREVFSDGNGLVKALYGCGYDGNCKNNSCYYDFNGKEICCCDSDNCNSNNAPKKNSSMPKETFERQNVETAKCYTNTTRGRKVLDCQANEVCMKNGDHFGCVAKENEICKEGHCCIGEKCNTQDALENIQCTVGVFAHDAVAIIEKNTTICQYGCTRVNHQKTITFSCAGNECIGKNDGCVGDRCCCFENDCGNFDRYPLPVGFEEIQRVLADPSVASLVSTTLVTLLVILITLF